MICINTNVKEKKKRWKEERREKEGTIALLRVESFKYLWLKLKENIKKG